MNEFTLKIKRAAEKDIFFTLHSAQQCINKNRMISPKEIRKVLDNFKIIEDYPYDYRGHTCLIGGNGENERTIHIVCYPTDKFLQIITTYIPEEKKWDNDFNQREDLWNV